MSQVRRRYFLNAAVKSRGPGIPRRLAVRADKVIV
jgi:hypothetical protein